MNAAEDQPQAPQEGQPSEEELRARLEEELRKLRVQDVLLQSVVSIINLTSRRIAKEDEKDLEQARVGIDALRALVDLLDDEPAEQVRNAISDLQVHYAKAAGGQPSEPAPEGAPGAPPEQDQPSEAGRKSSGLWTPPGT